MIFYYFSLDITPLDLLLITLYIHSLNTAQKPYIPKYNKFIHRRQKKKYEFVIKFILFSHLFIAINTITGLLL